MGLSFSGLSLVTAIGAELGINAEVREGVGGELQHRTAALTVNGPATHRRGGLSDIESDQEAVFYTGLDAQQPISRDLPPQASPFSAVWASAVGLTDPEVSLPVLEAPSILASEDLPVGRGAALERLADLLASSREAFEAAQDSELLQKSRWITGAPASGQDAASDFNATILRQAPQAESLAELAAALSQKDNPSTNLDGTTSSKESVTYLRESSPAKATHELRQIAREQTDAAKAAVTEQIAHNLSNRERELILDGTPPRNLREPIEKSGADWNRPGVDQHLEPGNTANIYAPPTTTPNAAPEALPSGPAERGSEPRTPPPAPLPQPTGGGIEVSATVATENRALHRSEVAFQAELRLRNQPLSSNAAPGNDRPVNGPRLTAAAVLGVSRARPETAQRQPADSEDSLKEVKNAQREAFRRIAGESGHEPPAQDHSGAGLDRGVRQATPIAAASAASQHVTPTASLPKPAAMPAAAQLDAYAPDAPAEISSPARSVAFKVDSGDRGAANVILTDRGGQVHVTVRSSDPALTQSLRSDLGSLSGNFQQHGFDVKVWNPSSNSSAGDHTRSHSFDFGQDDLRGDAHQRHFFDDTQQQRQRADWPEEID